MWQHLAAVASYKGSSAPTSCRTRPLARVRWAASSLRGRIIQPLRLRLSCGVLYSCAKAPASDVADWTARRWVRPWRSVYHRCRLAPSAQDAALVAPQGERLAILCQATGAWRLCELQYSASRSTAWSRSHAPTTRSSSLGLRGGPFLGAVNRGSATCCHGALRLSRLWLRDATSLQGAQRAVAKKSSRGLRLRVDESLAVAMGSPTARRTTGGDRTSSWRVQEALSKCSRCVRGFTTNFPTCAKETRLADAYHAASSPPVRHGRFRQAPYLKGRRGKSGPPSFPDRCTRGSILRQTAVRVAFSSTTLGRC